MVGVLGLKTGPPYFQSTPLYPENLPGVPSGLAVGQLAGDGRVDLVTALSGPRQMVVVENRSGMPCVGTSFGRAPRAYAAGDGPSSTAAADLDGDGHADLAVAAQDSKKLWLLENVAGHFAEFQPSTSVDVSPAIPTAVATADLDSDGKPDVVAALSGSDVIQVFRGNGLGGLIPGGAQSVGPNPSALVIGDFDGNGIPDVAAASETSGLVYVYRGDGLGGLAPGLATVVGAGPRALVAGYFNSGDTFSTWPSPTPRATASRSCWAMATVRSHRLSAPPWPSAPEPHREGSPRPTSTATRTWTS